MKSKSLRYIIMLRSRPEPEVSVEQKHVRFFAALADIPEPWGPGNRPIPSAPDTKRYKWDMTLTGYLGAGFVKSAHIAYAYRHDLQDAGARDDQFVLDIETRLLNMDEFVHRILPKYIVAFDAYRSVYRIDPRHRVGSDESPALSFEPRSEIVSVDLVQYWDAELLRRALGTTPEQIAAKFEGRIEDVKLIHCGVYLVGSSQPLGIQEYRECAARMKVILLESP